MPVNISDLRKARESLQYFREHAASPHHERYSFPFLCGSYFAYRKVDVQRIVAIAKSVSKHPSYADIGCGYGDFLEKIREYIPDAVGYEKDAAAIFYYCSIPKPDYIEIADANWIKKRYDVIFVGWMEPGADFRDAVSRNTDVIITTLDQGLSLAAEFDGHGFMRIAEWRTPSWEDVNIEIMNKYYTRIDKSIQNMLSLLRGAHNLWYVYARNDKISKVKDALKYQIEKENKSEKREIYDFEHVLDECGFRYLEKIGDNNNYNNRSMKEGSDRLWEIRFI